MATLCMKNIEQTQKIQEGKQRKNKKRNPVHKLMKEGRESLVVSPQARDQSKRVPLKEASI